MQPSHLLDDERWAGDRLGPERSRGAYAWRTMEQDGVHLAFGTDHPVEPLNPLRGIYACVTRQLPQGSPSWEPQASPSDKLLPSRLHRGLGLRRIREKNKGMIAPGMLADLVVYPGGPEYSSRARTAGDSGEDDHRRRPHHLSAAPA